MSARVPDAARAWKRLALFGAAAIALEIALAHVLAGRDVVGRLLAGYVDHPRVRVLTQLNQKLPKALSNGFAELNRLM